MPFSWWILIWESLFLLSLFLYGQELHLNQTSSWLYIYLLKSPLFLKPWLHPLCLHMKLSSVWCVIWCCSNRLLNGKLWPQCSQTKRRSLWRYICLSSKDCVANFLSHHSQSTIQWSLLWCSFSSLMEPNKSMQILHRMVQAGLLRTGLLLDISTGNIWSFVWLDVSTLETVPSLDGSFEGLDTARFIRTDCMCRIRWSCEGLTSVHNKYTGYLLKHLLLRHMYNLPLPILMCHAQALRSETSYCYCCALLNCSLLTASPNCLCLALYCAVL